MGSPRFIKNIRKRLAAWLLKGADTPAKTGGAAKAYRPESRQTVVPPAQETKEKKSPARRTVRWRPILIGSGLLMLACLLIGGTAAAMWVRGLDVSKLERPLPEPTLIMDRSGQPASQLSSSKIVPVPLEQIPLNLRNAIIAVEDRRFYEHAGIDVWSIFRALAVDLKSGSMAEGGSTLTQQLAKNMFLQSDKTISRKLKEAGYALKINLSYSKDEILELYLNSIYFGEGRWGVEGAAQEYFAKPVQQLTLEEAALLAALPKAPTTYSPAKNKDKALERRNLVLSLMKEQNFITDAAYKEASAKPIVLKQNSQESLKGKYPSYVDYVIQEAEDLYGFTEEQILTTGLRIYTYLDPKLQQTAQEVYAQDNLFPAGPGDQLIQSGAVFLDHHTGGIQALVGTRGPQVYRGFNHATQLKRQPGSSFKPLAVYGPALEQGYTPGSSLYDGPLDIAGYQPQDWDGQNRGHVSLQEAIVNSWNIPAVWLLNEIGLDEGLSFVRRAGIPLSQADRSLSMALGGLSEGVSPLQMAQAYSAIANLGVLQPAHAIAKVTTKDGIPLVEANPQPVQVTRPAVAYTLTLLLQEAVKSGTGQAASLGRPTAGKTGTTQLPDTAEFADIGKNGAKDAWFAGFTPELTAAVWLGYDQTDKTHYLTSGGGSVPSVLFKEIMSRALNGVPASEFPMPEEYRQQLLQQQEAERAAAQKAAQEAAQEAARKQAEEKLKHPFGELPKANNAFHGRPAKDKEKKR